MMRFNTIRFKIGVLYTAILGVILIVYSCILYVTLQNTLYHDFDRNLAMKAQAIVNTIESYVDILGYDEPTLLFAFQKVLGVNAEHPYQKMTEKLEIMWLRNLDLLGVRTGYINLITAGGASVVHSPSLEPRLRTLFAQHLRNARREKICCDNVRIDQRLLRVVTMHTSYRGKQEYIIQLGDSLAPVLTMMQTRLRYRIIPIPAILLLGFFIGQVFAARILKPVSEITGTARRIASGDLSARVETSHVDAEMQDLVEAFNHMISRLETSFKYIVDFSSHVAHELKTPLAIIRGEAEIVLRKDRELKEYKRVVTVALEEAQRMLKIIEGLLLLARLDYRADDYKFESFDVVPFAQEIYEQSRILAAERNIVIHRTLPQEPVMIRGDKMHLRRAFFNLIDNALKFTPQHGRIEIAVRRLDKNAAITVSDTGRGIGEKDLPKIFNRFYRLSAAGPNASSGVGLGLSIVQSIVKMHHGVIEVKSTPGQGTTFTVLLPLV